MSEFIEKYNDGSSYRELSAHFGVSLTTIQVYVKRLKLPKRETIDEIDKERFTKMWNAGDSLSEIGRKFGLCGTTISRIARKKGLKERTLKRATTKVAYTVISEPHQEVPKPVSTVPILAKPVQTEDKPKKSIFIVPTLGEIRKIQLKEEMMRIEKENKTFKRNLEND